MTTQTAKTPGGLAATIFKSLRIKQGLSQASVAERIVLPRSAYTNLENGKRDITLDDFSMLCIAFDVSPLEVARLIWK